ncbi:MAG: DUF4153 domain-containing protein [Saprospiraceae bacterium]|mgnify:CR=1 FL=1|nr:DUF4153 domain-containing protein [Saprospiraceae bacterium]
MIARYLKSLDLLKAFQNFPISSLLAVIATFSVIFFVDFPENNALGKIVAAGYLSFLSAISIEVYKKLSGKIWVLIVPFLVFVGWYLYLPEDINNIPKYLETTYAYRYMGTILLLHLFISFIPYLQPSAEEDFWEYNKHLFLRIFESVLFSLIIFVGLSLAILAIDKLFGINVDGEWYARLYIFLIGIFNSIYFLSKFPEIDYNGNTEKPASAYHVFSQYILIGISIIYLILLYAYALKILMEGSLPKGWIGYLTLCFSVVGILTWLLNYFNPKFSANRITKAYVQQFFKLLSLPVIMLFVAIAVRLSEYGITENRYIVASLATWLGILSLGYGWIKRFHIKYIPISFAVFVALATFGGPFDMFNVSLRSQANRLQNFLVVNEILKDRNLDISAVDEMNNTRKYELKTAINNLGNRSNFQIVDQWVDESLFEKYDKSSDNNKSSFLNKKLGVAQAQNTKISDNTYFNLNSKNNQKINVKGYSTMTYCRIALETLAEERAIKIVNGHQLELEKYDMLSIKNLILTHQGDNTIDINQSEMTLKFKNQTDSAKLLLEYIHGKIEVGSVLIEGGQGWLLESE